MSSNELQVERATHASSFALTLGLDYFEAQHDFGFPIRQAQSLEEVLNTSDEPDLGVLVLGPGVMHFEARAILSRTVSQVCGPIVILVGVGDAPERFQEFVDCGRVFYISRGPLAPKQLTPLISAAMNRYRARRDFGAADAALDYCVRIVNQTDLASLSSLLDEASRNTFGAERAYCLIYDAEKETLSSLDPTTREERIDSAVSGIAAFAARTGQQLVVENAKGDPRYDPETDNPVGADGDRMIVAPIFGGAGCSSAVLIATRSGDSPNFSPQEQQTFDFLVDCAGPPLNAILIQKRVERLLLSQTKPPDIFRQEALEHYAREQDSEGSLLQTSPKWLKNSHWLTLVLLVVCLVFPAVVPMRERATGPAIIRARNRVPVVTTASGVVSSVEVFPGEYVRRGDLILQFQQLRSGGTGRAFQNQLRAPSDGVVGDIRVRSGQQLASGEWVASIIDGRAGYELIAFLPERYAPQVRHGMQVTFKVDGYPDSHEASVIDDIGNQVIGPRGAEQYADTDTLSSAGPIVIVRSVLSRAQFSSGGAPYEYRDGMTGQVEVTLSSEPMFLQLVPRLKQVGRNLK
jgi:GAF domain-containing protein